MGRSDKKAKSVAIKDMRCVKMPVYLLKAFNDRRMQEKRRSA